MNVGLQTQRCDHSVPIYFVRAKAGVVKIIDPQSVGELNKLRVALPNATFIFRKHFGSQPLDNPRQRAVQVYDAIMPHASQFKYDLIEGYNEVGYWDDGPNYSIFTVELSKLLHRAGQKHLAYSFGVGHPAGYATFPYEQDPLAWLEGLRCHWAVYLEGLAEADALGLHQYKLPQHNDFFTLFRHHLVEKVLPPELAAKPIYITEFGLDEKGDAKTSGWNGNWGWSPEQYATWIIETAREIGNEVAGIALFICGTYGWVSFDVLGHPMIADAIALVNEEKKMVEPIRVVKPAGTVVTLDMEEYLRGVIPREVYPAWPVETLKAQAVAARTYAKRAVKHPRHDRADICTTSHCQNLGISMYPSTDRAVEDTVGIYLVDSMGEIYLSQYISKCGLLGCPYCKGTDGYNGHMWPGRMCQWGAKVFGDWGFHFRAILKHYYPNALFSDQPDPTTELRKQIADMKADIQTLAQKWM